MKYLVLLCILLGLLVINGNLFKHKNKFKNHSKTKTKLMTQADELFDLKKEAFCDQNNLGMFRFNLRSFGKITLDAFNRKVANDEASWCFDALDPLMSKIFNEDAEKAWKFYHGQSKEGLNPFFELGDVSPLPKERQDQMVGYVQLRGGMTSGGLIPTLRGKTIKEIFSNFDFNGDRFFNYQEFILFMIETTAKQVIPLTCTNCFVESRKQLKKLFDYMDCDKNLLIDSEDMWNGWKEMRTFNLFTTASTNDLELKCDTNNDAYLSPQEFIEGILHGYWERQVGPDGPSDAYKALKKVREQNYEARKKKEKAKGGL